MNTKIFSKTAFLLIVTSCCSWAISQQYIVDGPVHVETFPFRLEPIGEEIGLTVPKCKCTSSTVLPPAGAFRLIDEMNFFLAVDGSKQPQDFGVNANLGGQVSVNAGIPILSEYGIGTQFGTGLTASSNAVRVYELLGESTGRTQSFTTIGLFQRMDNGLSWGFVYDFLSEKSFDTFQLGQWRLRGSYLLNPTNEIGVFCALKSYSDNGIFGSNTNVTLSPINQGSLFCRHFWGTGAQTTGWVGIAEKHGENNAVTGPSPNQELPFLFGADVLMPLTASLAIYGETNMIMPSDTGTVDAFLGLQWFPGKRSFTARRRQYSPLMSLASPTNFSVDLSQ